jgi:hypothetical protein
MSLLVFELDTAATKLNGVVKHAASKIDVENNSFCKKEFSL